MNGTTCAPDDDPIPPRRHGFEMTCGEHSPAHVRRIVRGYLRLWGLPHLTDAAEIATSELLANVIRHVPDRWCRLTLLRHDEGIRIEITDRHPVLPVVQPHDVWRESGRGLDLVAAVTDAMGVTRLGEGGGKTVWCEMKA